MAVGYCDSFLFSLWSWLGTSLVMWIQLNSVFFSSGFVTLYKCQCTESFVFAHGFVDLAKFSLALSRFPRLGTNFVPNSTTTFCSNALVGRFQEPSASSQTPNRTNSLPPVMSPPKKKRRRRTRTSCNAVSKPWGVKHTRFQWNVPFFSWLRRRLRRLVILSI